MLKILRILKDITAVGTVSSDDLATSGNVRSMEKLQFLESWKTEGLETSKNIAVAEISGMMER
ncbi:hypothetical protein [Leptotrichia alba]|uniref:Uncharacterized protein n=1 Tax=Leptotrichia alba TaxID=3239304 RepID=A0AB39V7K1_9FUSO